jgi:hypothetical protein
MVYVEWCTVSCSLRSIPRARRSAGCTNVTRRRRNSTSICSDAAAANLRRSRRGQLYISRCNVNLMQFPCCGMYTQAHARTHTRRPTVLTHLGQLCSRIDRNEPSLRRAVRSVTLPRVSDSARRSPLPARWQERLRRAVLPCCNAHGRRCQRRPPASRPLELCNPQRHEAHRSVCVRVFPPVEI